MPSKKSKSPRRSRSKNRSGLSLSKFVQAARLVKQHEFSFSCCLLDDVGGRPERLFYEQVYELGSNRRGFWRASYSDERDVRAEEQVQHTRVIALLFAAELLRDGFTSEDFSDEG